MGLRVIVVVMTIETTTLVLYNKGSCVLYGSFGFVVFIKIRLHLRARGVIILKFSWKSGCAIIPMCRLHSSWIRFSYAPITHAFWHR